MAAKITLCKTCGKEISSKAKTCPHCGGKNKTAIYISHRLSSCIFCDRIAVFDKAKLVEEGTHEQLLKSGKKYSELWNAQAQYYKV